MKAWENYVYMVVKRGVNSYFVERQHMRYDDVSIPRIDRKQQVTLNEKSTALDGTDVNDPRFDSAAFNMYFDASTVTTTVRVPIILNPLEEYEILSTDGVAYKINSITPTSTYSDVVVAGQLDEGENLWIGRKFTMSVQLSTQFVRGDDNNPRQGVLNIASMETKHYDTGNYDIVVTRRDRPTSDVLADYDARDPDLSNYTTTFAAPQSDAYKDSVLPIGAIEFQGQLVSKIMGFSDKIEIYILSDYLTPVNITNILLTGKFKQTYSSLT